MTAATTALLLFAGMAVMLIGCGVVLAWLRWVMR
jgi:hypothetical protein